MSGSNPCILGYKVSILRKTLCTLFLTPSLYVARPLWNIAFLTAHLKVSLFCSSLPACVSSNPKFSLMSWLYLHLRLPLPLFPGIVLSRMTFSVPLCLLMLPKYFLVFTKFVSHFSFIFSFFNIEIFVSSNSCRTLSVLLQHFISTFKSIPHSVSRNKQDT